MADHVDSPPNVYAGFFQRRVVRSVQHWQSFVAKNQADTPALERDQAQILRAISFALTSEAAWPAARELIETYAPYMERRGYWETWHDILTQAGESARQFNDTPGQVTLMALLSRLLQRQSRFKEAIHYYRRVIRLARQTGNRFEEARACSNLGYLYTDSISRWWRAEILCCHALTVFEELDSLHGQAHTNNHLGILFTRQQEWNKAEDHLQRACNLWQTMGDNYGLVHGFENLGMLYYEIGNTNEALVYLEKALDQVRFTGAEAEFGNIWTNMGLVYHQNGDSEQAEIYMVRAETIFSRFSDALGLARVWGSLGRVYLHQNKWTDAIQYLEKSLIVHRHLNNTDGQIKTLIDIVEYEFAIKDYSQTTLRLNALEGLISEQSEGEPKKYWAEQAKKYRHRLSGLMD